MGDVALWLRSRWQPREWPRYRDGARADERAWLESMSDRELAEHCAALGRIDKAVRDHRKPHLVVDDLLSPESKDAA